MADQPRHGQAEQLQGGEQVHRRVPDLGAGGRRMKRVSRGKEGAITGLPRPEDGSLSSAGAGGSACLGAIGARSAYSEWYVSWPEWTHRGQEGDPHRLGGGGERVGGPFSRVSPSWPLGERLGGVWSGMSSRCSSS